jgi:hypothetical protein
LTKSISVQSEIVAPREKVSWAVGDACLAQLWFSHALRGGSIEPHPEFAVAVIEEDNPNEFVYKFTKIGWEGFAEISVKQLKRSLTRVLVNHYEIEGLVHGSDEETAKELDIAWRFKTNSLKRFVEKGIPETGFKPFVTSIPKQTVATVTIQQATADRSDPFDEYFDVIEKSGVEIIGERSLLIDSERKDESYAFRRIGRRGAKEGVKIRDFNETNAVGAYFHGTPMDFYPTLISLVQWAGAHKIKPLGPLLEEFLERNDRTRVETRKIMLLMNNPEPSKLQQISQGWLVFPDNWARWVGRA